MRNDTNIKVGKKYENMISHVYKDCSGYWCELEEGYIFSNMDCGSICEQKQSDLLNAIRNNIVAVETPAVEVEETIEEATAVVEVEETPAVIETVEEETPAVEETKEVGELVPALISEIMFDTELSTNLKVTYVSMLTVVGTGAEYTKVQWAEFLNTSDRQFVRNIRGLEEAGLVNVVSLATDTGRQLNNRYEIFTPAGNKVGIV